MQTQILRLILFYTWTCSLILKKGNPRLTFPLTITRLRTLLSDPPYFNPTLDVTDIDAN